jgi:Fe-S cluster assembly protein SufD
MHMSSTDVLTGIKRELIELYDHNAASINSNVGETVNSCRKKALEDFDLYGIPDKKNEAYRYTDIQPFFKGDYVSEFSNESFFKVNLRDIFRCDVPELDTHVILLLNGFYYNGNGSSSLPENISVCSFAEASLKYPDIFSKYYSLNTGSSEDGLVALNTLFAQDGIFIHIPENVVLEKPLQIININYSFKNLRIFRRNLIVADRNTQARIIVCDHTLCRKSYLTNSLTEIYAGENSFIDYYKIQNENNLSTQISNTFISQGKSSNVTSNTISLHGGLIRNNFFVSMNGEGAENNLYGLFLCDQKQHVAYFTDVRHEKPHCRSNQLFKGVLDDQATGSFNGKINVSKDAQKTVAYQRNNNILLSDDARIHTKPHLEIYADDVKCSHGATIGQLDNEALFYIKTRGISEDEAKYLLMYAFANEIISEIKIPYLKERIIDLVDKRLRGELSRCNDCNIRCG